MHRFMSVPAMLKADFSHTHQHGGLQSPALATMVVGSEASARFPFLIPEWLTISSICACASLEKCLFRIFFHFKLFIFLII